MKSTKKHLSQSDHFNTDQSVDLKSQNKYLKQIAYWVGYFIFEFNALESTLTDLLSLHIGGGDQNVYQHIFLTGLTFAQKVELLERIYELELTFLVESNKQDDIKKDLDEIIVELKSWATLRNTIVHADYYTLDQDGYVREKTKYAQADAIENWVVITRDFLVENVNRVIEFTDKLAEFDNTFH